MNWNLKIVTRYLLLNWLVPVLIASVSFYFLQPYIASLVIDRSDLPLSFYLAAGGQVPVTAKEIDGNSHIVYQTSRLKCTSSRRWRIIPQLAQCLRAGGDEVRVTNNQLPNAEPQIDGKYLAWVTELRGGWQVMMHYLPSGVTIPLALSGNNVNVSLAGRYLSWEMINDNNRTVMLFDGVSLKKMTPLDATSINPSVSDDNQLIFAQRRGNNDPWQAVSYDLNSGAKSILKTGEDAKYPRFEQSEVKFGFVQTTGGQVAGAASSEINDTTPANPSDLSKPPSVSVEEIKRELNYEPVIR